MSTSDFTSIVMFLVLAILVVGALGTLSKNRFRRTKYKDEFKNKAQIGKHNIGVMKQEKTYREIVKDRNLSEATKLEPRINPKVTRSIAKVTKDVREKD